MILIPYPNKEHPRALLNLEQISSVKVRDLGDDRYLVKIHTTNEYGDITVGDNVYYSKDDAETALKEFYEFLNECLNGN